MKFVAPDNRNAVLVWRMTLALAVAGLVPILLYGSAPAWWSQRGVLVQDQSADDYAPVNQGQLKNIANAAVAEMDAKLSGGAGEELHSLISSWSSPNPTTNDFAPVNLGQLKNVARPFYDRLVSAGIADHYPWQTSLTEPDDFAAANIGQVKKLFGFNIPVNQLQDPLGERLAAGEDSANLALEAHAVWIWGDHFSNGIVQTYPRRIQGLSSVSSVSAGERHLVILGGDGTVWTWGENADGQLGDGTTDKHDSPAPVPNLSNVAAVRAGGLHTLALLQDDTVLAWGDNHYGQLGDGDTTSSPMPTVIIGLDNVRKIAAGYQRSIALKNDGTVWIWGYDHYAWQNEQDLFNTIPVLVPDLTDVVEIAAGYEHNVVVKADGTVWAWGSNYANQIGDASPSWKFQDTPTQVANLVNIKKVASSYDHTLALASDGTVWAWGNNFSGQLGDGTNQPRQTPVQVSGLTDVIAMATGYSYSLAMKADGTVWAWGTGATGTLSGTDKRIPQLVTFGNSDANHNGMDDRWELQYLGNLNQSADADLDGDGVSNLREFLRGSDPTDYYDGTTPIIEIAGGNNQIGDPGAFLAKPFVARIRNAVGQLLTNAPVNFVITSGSGGLAQVPGAPKQPTLLARTDPSGEAKVYHTLPQAAGTSTRTTATAGKSGTSASVTFRSIAKFSLPPPPTPSPPPPDASPTPTPSATPTPAPPYRYAIIDLGKDLTPLRIANNGNVLLYGTANDQWGYFRWRGGALERLSYGDNFNIEAADMNDDGVVVGVLYQSKPWVNNTENEIEAGLEWPANSSAPVKVSASVAVANIAAPEPGSVRQAAFTAINNRNEVYGRVRTGVVIGGVDSNYIPVLNAYSWPATFGTPTALSSASARMDPSMPQRSLWQGSSDTVLRASSSGHYIGRKFTPAPAMFGILQGTTSGMIDGQSVPFSPNDINEAGIVVGSAGANMIVYSSPSSQVTINGASPLAINDHVQPLAAPTPQSSPAASPQPTPMPAPQILAWVGNAVVMWERQADGQTWHPFGLEEMIPSMDGWEYLSPYDMNDTGAIIGEGWYTDPSIPHAQMEKHAFLLVPVELMVDGNRDGEMSFINSGVSTSDQTSEDKPYRFWVNDDQDNVGIGTVPTSYGDGETVPPSNPNYDDPNIRTVRDLEDWSRLWLSFAGIVDLVKTPDVAVELAFEASEGQPAIKVCRAVESDGARRYLVDASTAAAQLAGDFGIVHGPISSVMVLNLKDSGRSGWIDDLTNEHPTLRLLFEGSAEGKGKLHLRIKKGGRIIMRSPDLCLDLKNVRRMYERAKITLEAPDVPDPWNNDHPAPLQWTWDPWNWPPSIDPNATEQTIVYVHGWRMTYYEYLGWADTTFKRLFQLGYKGRFFSFHWPTFNGENNGVNPADLFVPGGTTYNPSEYRAWLSGPALADFANRLPNPNARYLLAHSMGNVAVGAALRSGMQLTRYAMCNSAMAAMAYDANVIDYNYETPDTDVDPGTRETYGLADKLNPVPTELINFSLPADYALGQWAANNEFFKPQPQVGHSYHYRSFYPPGLKLTYEGSISVRPITSVPEAMGFVTRSRSAAAGAKQSTRGSIGSFVNMGPGGFEFGTEHSAEWVYPLQKTGPFWSEILKKFDVDVQNP